MATAQEIRAAADDAREDVRPVLNPKSPLESLLAPGLRLMQVVRLPVKFAIIAAALLVPLCVAVYGVVGYSEANIAFGAR